MTEFFLYRTELPIGGGFSLFGGCHLLWLTGIGIFSWWIGKFFSFAECSVQKKLQRSLRIIFPVGAFFRDMLLCVLGHFHPVEYPLHLCNMAVWMITIFLWTGNRFVGDVYVLLCVPAALLALVFPGWLRYPFLNFMHIYNFLYHGLLVAVGWYLICSKQIMPRWKDMWKPLLFGLFGYFALLPVNQLLGTNFWFLNKPSYGSPLAWIYERLGEEWYLIGHFMFCASVIILWQGLLQRIIKNQNRKEVFMIKNIILKPKE